MPGHFRVILGGCVTGPLLTFGQGLNGPMFTKADLGSVVSQTSGPTSCDTGSH